MAARWLVTLVDLYVLAGAVFAAAFVSIGIGRVDPVARHSSWGFRLIVMPGAMALWPWLLVRWLRSGKGLR